jgi:hypothetical protein
MDPAKNQSQAKGSNSQYKKLFAVAVFLPYVFAIYDFHYQKNVSSDYFIYGSGSWGIACIVKMFLYHGVVQYVHRRKRSIEFISVLNGLFSGITELGAASIFFWFLPKMNFWQVVAFGTGIGTIEAIVAVSISDPLKGTALEKGTNKIQALLQNLPGKQKFFFTLFLPWSERMIAGILHIGTRGLVYVSISQHKLLPFGLALAIFILVDGVIVYRMLFAGKLKTPRDLSKMYLALLLLSMIALISFLLFWHPAAIG